MKVACPAKGMAPGNMCISASLNTINSMAGIAVLASGQGQILYYSPRGEHLGTVNLSVKADDFKLTPAGRYHSVLRGAG